MPSLVFTNLNIPTTASFPSTSSLQWSGDGQLLFVTKNEVYVMTPDHVSTIFKCSSFSNTSHNGWFRTLIEFDKGSARNWPDSSQEWGAAALGSLDMGIRAVTCSPSCVTEDGGCVIAVLSSNMDLSLWAASKNKLQGEWVKIYNVTAFLLGLCSQTPITVTAQVLQAQVTSITWSSQADFGITPAPCLNASLLVVGTRAGDLIFLKSEFDGPKATVAHVATIQAAEKWISHVAFSRWSFIERGKCGALVAYSTSDGFIGLGTVTQTLESSSSSSDFRSNHKVTCLVEKQQQWVSDVDKRGLTALTWVVSRGVNILVYCKPGVVSLWSHGSSALGWTGHRSLVLLTQALPVGSSSLQQVSGLHHVRCKDMLIVSLFDGSFHLIYNLSCEPSLTPPTSGDYLTSHALSAIARSFFEQTENRKVTPADVNRVSGLVSHGDYANVLWTHESCQPADFSYKYDAKHCSMLIAAQLWTYPDDDTFINEIMEILNTTKTTSGKTPLHVLRPLFWGLQQRRSVHSRVLLLLRSEAISSCVASTIIAPTSDNWDLVLRDNFRRSLSTHLFGFDFLLQLRLKLFLANFLWGISTDVQKRAECTDVAQNLLCAVSQAILWILIRHLSSVRRALTLRDVPFALRIINRALLLDPPSDLSIEAQNLLDDIRVRVLSLNPPEAVPNHLLTEDCPACGSTIVLEGGTHALCPNGHTWNRCSITSFILSTPIVRTCSGCERKAFPPPRACTETQVYLPETARSWIVEELLGAARHCLFCGNGFVRIL